ncbi:alkaline phosphatase D family protein [Marinobacterium mangrovicola]|uniref:PhoD-like phosphatase n=1 Tax=Marinobacterium mangrovicola TaxID=1476959 RepID=A0A4V2PEF7_9GAMM|nr:alkaline phosphatase D family protein [Marinobacterium mangrovicola]TCK08796.1 hypothetical protein CLV83_0889 [Marinobacterium mangrovicola]
MSDVNAELPTILVGPILRRVEANRLVIWLLTTAEVPLGLKLTCDGQTLLERELSGEDVWTLPLGERCWLRLVDIEPDSDFPLDSSIEYDLSYKDADRWVSLAEWGSELLYPGESLPSFQVKSRLGAIFHGSCRKPHHPGADGMARADTWLEQHRNEPDTWPAVMMLSGDQIYADDVAGPMLVACHELSDRLGLWHEQFEDACVADTSELVSSEHCYYQRERLLPEGKTGETARRSLFSGVKKPIFTSDNAHNHLISFAEMIAAYCLAWSPCAWSELKLALPDGLDDQQTTLYYQEREVIDAFREQLPRVRRVMAHLPTYMIFDDHDVTDDWNLSAAWEVSAYGHPFSRRIIGNALIAYLLCQGLGNNPGPLKKNLGEPVERWLGDRRPAPHDELIETLTRFEGWDYLIPMEPAVLVLDTRTRRWRAESNLASPSGLMDWEALTELQQQLLDREAVVLVSAAPVFGVKLIETVQKVFTWFGHPLMVDAENWMAHPGAANVMLNIFRHTRTPKHFVILSGDVHYSFVYDIEIRFRKGGPKIWQITSSGLKNEFPDRLLKVFDRLNRWLYAPWSPLNWFTRRRRMRVSPRRPEGADEGCRLVNSSGMGLVRFAADGEPEEVWQLGADGRDTRFSLSDEEEHWG